MKRFVKLLLGIMTLTAVMMGAAQPTDGGTLRFGLLSEPASLDPHVYSGDQTMVVKQVIYSTLVRFSDEGGVFVGDLATSWEALDPETFVFHLHPDAVFHNGDPVTAEDVRFSFERIIAPGSTATRHRDFQIISAIETPSDHEIVFHLSEPSAAFLGYIARPESAIVSKRFVEEGADLSTEVLGSGPFVFDSYETGIALRVTRNESYYGDAPHLDAITFVPIPDEGARVNALLSGDVDVIHFIPWAAFAQIESNPSFTLYLHTDAVLFLQYKADAPPFDDVRVREAIGYAINRDAVIRAAFLGYGTTITGGAIPADHVAHNADLEGTYTYDPDHARELLEEAGVIGQTITIDTYSLPFAVRTAEVIQNNLEQVGLNAEIVVSEWPSFQEKTTQEQNFQARVYGAGWRVPDLDFYTPFVGTGGEFAGPGHFSDPELDQLLATGRSTVDPEERYGIYHQIEERVLEESPMSFIAWRVNAWAASKAVHGLTLVPDPMGSLSGFNLSQTWLER